MIRRVFLAILVFGVTACGDDGTGLQAIIGTYTLQSIDGEGLPAVVSPMEDPVIVKVTAGSLLLNEGTTCTSSFRTTKKLEDGTVTEVVDAGVCTYTFNNGALSLNFPDGSSTTSGSISGSTLTVTLGETVFVFVK